MEKGGGGGGEVEGEERERRRRGGGGGGQRLGLLGLCCLILLYVGTNIRGQCSEMSGRTEVSDRQRERERGRQR